MGSLINFHIHIPFMIPQLSSKVCTRSIFSINHFLNMKLKTPVPRKTQGRFTLYNQLRMELCQSLLQYQHCHPASENIQSSHLIVYKSEANPNAARLACSSNSYTSGIISQQSLTTRFRRFPYCCSSFHSKLCCCFCIFCCICSFSGRADNSEVTLGRQWQADSRTWLFELSY